MKNARQAVFVVAVLVLMAGCATHFSPNVVRAEIVRQTGEDPQEVFEMDVGRMTMSMAKRVIGSDGATGDGLPLSGLTKFELAVYGLPAEVLSGTRALDFTTMKIRGWESTVRFRDGGKSGLVLVRSSGDSIGDLVLLVAGEKKATYVRLQGSLPKELPEALGEAVRVGGSEAVERELKRLGQ